VSAPEAGLPVTGAAGKPVAALIVAAYPAPGGAVYQVHATSGLSSAECLRMAEYAVARIEDALEGGQS
jgi:hypothetical protein